MNQSLCKKKQYELWFGVKVCVEAADSEEAERKAREWIGATLAANPDRDEDVTHQLPLINLAEVAVRVLNQMGEERRRREEIEAMQEIEAVPGGKL